MSDRASPGKRAPGSASPERTARAVSYPALGLKVIGAEMATLSPWMLADMDVDDLAFPIEPEVDDDPNLAAKHIAFVGRVHVLEDERRDGAEIALALAGVGSRRA